MTTLSSPLLDTLIGLVFIILMFSIMHSGVLEMYQTIGRRRNHFLLKAIEKVFNDRANVNFCEQLFQHPLIQTTKPKPQTLPAYISSTFFADALTGVFLQRSIRQPLVFNKTINQFEIQVPGAVAPKSADMFNQFREVILQLKQSPTQQIMMEWILSSNNIVEFKKTVANWFDGYMESVSSQYKRQLVRRSITIGIAIAILTNASLLNILQTLWKDQDKRNQIVTYANAYKDAHPDGLTTELPVMEQATQEQTTVTKDTIIQVGNEKKRGITQTITTTGQGSDSTTQNVSLTVTVNKDGDSTIVEQEIVPEVKKKAEDIHSIWTEINNLGLPIGWNSQSFNTAGDDDKMDILGYVLQRLFGWILMGLAMAWGAENWFNILSKFIQLRTAVKPETNKNKA